MKALILAAGAGSRFEAAGYTFPKPLIDVNGKAMLEVVIDTLPECEEYIFACRTQDVEQYNMDDLLKRATDDRSRVVCVDKLTSGAAATALLCEEFIDNNEELIIANSDQYIEYDIRNFNLIRKWCHTGGIVFCFNACHPKWSFAELNSDFEITRIAEKDPISNVATCGIYYWSAGKVFVKYAKQMIENNITVRLSKSS